MYTPCSVAGRVSIATGPVVEKQLAASTAADDDNDDGGGNDDDNIVIVVVIVVVSVDVAVLHVHLLFAVYPELG